jgi:molybdopterin/thiamine biosynthesis adenylyltransferase
MALADYFDRAATAASQVLANFHLEAFEGDLRRHVVGIAFDASAVRSPEGLATLDLCVRLLARLYPTLAILPLDAGAQDAASAFVRLAEAVNPRVGFGEGAGSATVCVAVGTTRPSCNGPVVYVGSDEWTARLSRAAPIGSGKSDNPFGAGAAACFAAANVFRAVFPDQLPGGGPDETIDLSMLTYDAAGPSSGLDVGTVDLGETHLVGLGAIGNGAVWALSRSRGLHGTLHLVDHEPVEMTNLQRYVMASQDHLSVPKVDLAASMLSGTTLDVRPHAKRWDAYVQGRGDWRFERVAVALDTAAARLAVQAALPRWIVNAWTQEHDLGVSRHGFDDGKACLACLYMPEDEGKSEDLQVAEELGMPEAQIEVRTLLQTHAPVDAGFVARVAHALGIPSEPLMPFAGQPLRTFYQGAICGGLAFRLSGGARAGKAVVPMSFQSALAGIMLVADLVKHAAGVPQAPMTSTRINLLRPLGRYLHDPKARDASGRCICSDADFVDAYRRKYAA